MNQTNLNEIIEVDSFGNPHDVITSLGVRSPPIEERNTLIPRLAFDTPQIVAKYNYKLTDYSKSKIRSRFLNHLSTYRGIQTFMLAAPLAVPVVYNSQFIIPETIKPMIKSADQFLENLLNRFDTIVPYRFRTFPLSQLSAEQKEIKEYYAMGVRAFAFASGVAVAMYTFSALIIIAFLSSL